ncbi:hypothetical protein F5141DRAFT_1080309 [Pisolithus sp. B1]|nr:hypothetical protein F5141DRAFT_1080309 [Pisolithus sp. B1]
MRSAASSRLTTSMPRTTDSPAAALTRTNPLEILSHSRPLRMVLWSWSTPTKTLNPTLQLVSDTILAKDGYTLSVTNTFRLKTCTGQTLAREHTNKCGIHVQNTLGTCPNKIMPVRLVMPISLSLPTSLRMPASLSVRASLLMPTSLRMPTFPDQSGLRG